MSKLIGSTTVAIRKQRAKISLGVADGSHVTHAEEADKLSTPRKVTLTGAVEGSAVFDGSDDLLIYTQGQGDPLTIREIDEIIDEINRQMDDE